MLHAEDAHQCCTHASCSHLLAAASITMQRVCLGCMKWLQASHVTAMRDHSGFACRQTGNSHVALVWSSLDASTLAVGSTVVGGFEQGTGWSTHVWCTHQHVCPDIGCGCASPHMASPLPHAPWVATQPRCACMCYMLGWATWRPNPARAAECLPVHHACMLACGCRLRRSTMLHE